MNEGRKDDSGKPDLTYMRDVYEALCTVCQVFQFGARKYGRDNWRMVAYDRYDRALLRHALRNGNDDESGLPHWAHAVACALIYATNKLPAPKPPVNGAIVEALPWLTIRKEDFDTLEGRREVSHAIQATIDRLKEADAGAVLRLQQHEKDCAVFSSGPCSCRVGAP